MNQLTENISVESVESLPVNQLRQPLSVPIVSQLLTKNYSQADIARIFGVSDQAVSQFIQRNKDELEVLKTFKDNKAQVLEELQFNLVKSVDDNEIKKMQPYQKITSIGILEDKIQQIQGHTSNKNNISIVLNLACKSHETIDVSVDNPVDK